MNPLEKPSTRKSRKKPWLYLILLIPLLLIGFLLVNQPSSELPNDNVIPPNAEVNDELYCGIISTESSDYPLHNVDSYRDTTTDRSGGDGVGINEEKNDDGNSLCTMV